MKNDDIREKVRQAYGKVAASGASGCGCAAPSCCNGAVNATDLAMGLGYSAEDIAAVPEGANMGLGCGNPGAIASLKPGETVLDLGSGGGFDCFLAGRAVGDSGQVIGVDMTPEMVAKARRNAEQLGAENVEFRLGELENLPVADGTVDVVISNCVINLSPDKERVFKEVVRVLKPGGRVAISDVVATAEMPDTIRNDPLMLAGCIAGAVSVSSLEAMMKRAGFKNIRIQPRVESRAFIRDWMPGSRAEEYVASAVIEAVKPPA